MNDHTDISDEDNLTSDCYSSSAISGQINNNSNDPHQETNRLGALDTSDTLPQTTEIEPNTFDRLPQTSELEPNSYEHLPETSEVVPNTSDHLHQTSELESITSDPFPQISEIEPNATDPRTSETKNCQYVEAIINNGNFHEGLVDVFGEIVEDDSNWLYDLSRERSSNISHRGGTLDWLRSSFNEDDLTLVRRSLSSRLSQFETISFSQKPPSTNAKRPSNFISDFYNDNNHSNFGYSTFKIKRNLPSYTLSPTINYFKTDSQKREIYRKKSTDEIDIRNNRSDDVLTPLDVDRDSKITLPTVQASQIPNGSSIKRPSALPKFPSRRNIQSPLTSPRPDISPSVDTARTKVESILQRRRLLPQTPTKSSSLDLVESPKTENELLNANPEINLPTVTEDVNFNPLLDPGSLNNGDINSNSCGNSTNSSKENLNRTYSKEELSVLKAQVNEIIASSSNNSSELDISDSEDVTVHNNQLKPAVQVGRFTVYSASKSNLGKSMDCLTQKSKSNTVSYQGGLTRSKSTFRYTDHNKNNSTTRENTSRLSKQRAASSNKLSTISDIKSPINTNQRSIKPPSISTNPSVSTPRKSSLPVRNKPTTSSIPRPSTASRGLPSPKVIPNNRQVSSAILPRKVYKK